MATASATKATRKQARRAPDAPEENVRNLRRAVVAGRNAAEDWAAETTLQIWRRPFTAVGLAVGVGCLLGFTLGRYGRAG